MNNSLTRFVSNFQLHIPNGDRSLKLVQKTSKMESVFLSTALLLSLQQAEHRRGGILTVTYSEAIELSKNNRDSSYLNEPLIITDSPMTQWTLYQNLEKIFGSEYPVKVNKQSTDCSCFADSPIRSELCEQLASTFLYSRPSETYSYWKQHQNKNKYIHCVHKQPDAEMNVHDAIQSVINRNNKTHFYSADISDNSVHLSKYTKLYSYFKIFEMRGFNQMVTATQLNTLDQIHLSPYFDIFDMNGFLDVNDVNIWFGTEYYRTIRHFDKADNLFFLLSGSRKFQLSAPSINVFPLHPFLHPSGRQQLAYYPLLQTGLCAL